MKTKKIKIELTLDDLLNIIEMSENYIDVTSKEINIDDDLLKSYETTLDKIVEVYNNNRK